jgi:hypothetical protein
MAVIGELLFWRRDGVDLDSVLRHQGDAGVKQAVEALPEKDVAAETDETLVQRVLTKTAVAPLAVAFDSGDAQVVEIMVNAQTVFGEQIRAKGLRATKAFSFTGDAELWHLRTNPYDMNPPRGVVDRRKVTVGMEVRDHEGNQAAAHIEDSVRRIKECLQRQEAQIATFNATLPGLILPVIHRRRQTLSKAADLLKKLQG